MNKISVITGANDGIGKETAKILASSRFKVLMVCRNHDKAEVAKQEILKENPNAELEIYLADLSLISEVKTLAQSIVQDHPVIDVLINNAAAVFHEYELTQEGIERQFAINHLAPFYLTFLLLPVLKKAEEGRIVNVSSHAHFGASLDFENLFFQHNYVGVKMYKRTKLCNILFTYELAKKLKGTTVCCNCLHPGIVETRIGSKHASSLIKLAWRLIKFFKRAISAEEGAATSVYLAKDPRAAGISGKYFYKCKEVESDPVSYDGKATARLWELSKNYCGI